MAGYLFSFDFHFINGSCLNIEFPNAKIRAILNFNFVPGETAIESQD